MRIHHRSLLFTLVAGLLAACADAPTSPAAGDPEPLPAPGDSVVLAGRYALHAAEGNALPALIIRSTDTLTHEVIDVFVVSDTIELSTDGRYTKRALIEARVDSHVVSRSHMVDRGRVSRSALALAFESELIQNVTFSGVLQGADTIRVEQDLAGEGQVVSCTFRRVP